MKRTIPNEVYEKSEDGYLLKVYLPCVNKEDIVMHEAGQDLIVKIGNFKRAIPMPPSLRGHYVQSAKMEDQSLLIQFVKETSYEKSTLN